MVSTEDLDVIRSCSRDEASAERLSQLFVQRTAEAAKQAERGFNLAGFLAQSSDVLVAYDPELRYTLINELGAAQLGRPVDEVVGKTNRELIGPGAEAIEPYVRECFSRATKVFVVHEIPTSSGVLLFDSVYTPVLGEDGRVERVVGICRDVTTDRMRLKQMEQKLAAQASMLQEISTPLLNIHPGILLMPLVGSIDDRRTAQMSEVLLRGIADYSAHTALIDITGVSQVDSRVAAALVSGAKAARLLGARVVLTGVSPEVARTLVELGIDLGGVDTYSSLQQGFSKVLAPR